MKRSILSMLLMLVAIASLAQERLISGKITDRDTKEPVEQVTIQLLKTDSTYVSVPFRMSRDFFMSMLLLMASIFSRLRV